MHSLLVFLLAVLRTTSPGDSLLRAGLLEEAVPVLLQEIREGDHDSWLMYRLGWAYNRLEMPDSALAWAVPAWEGEPWNSWRLGEVLRALCSLGRYAEASRYEPWVDGGGVCRYYLARAELESADPDAASLEWFRSALGSESDSVSADAACWLSILLADSLSPDSVLGLAMLAVSRAPDDEFYRCRCAVLLARQDRAAEAVDCLLPLRRNRISTQAYWQAWAEIAAREGDSARELWALRRAWQNRRTPGAAGDLGWALYLAGREALGQGSLELAGERLAEARGLGSPADLFVRKSDSLLVLLDEYSR